MLQEISWKDYWTFITTVTAIYWLIIISFFYRYEILMLAKRKRDDYPKEDLSIVPEHSNKVLASQQPLPFQGNEAIEETYLDESFIDDDELLEINLTPYAHGLATEIKEQIEAAEKKKLVKEELLFALQQIINTYPHLKGTFFQKDISNLIAAECENHCSIHLNAEEMKMLWVS